MKNIEILNLCNYYGQAGERLKCLTTKTKWTLKKNMDKLMSLAKSCEELRADLVKPLQPYWNEEHARLESSGWVVKPEFTDEYKPLYEDISAKVKELFDQDNDIDLIPIDVDAEVDALPADTPLTFDDFTFLEAFKGR